MSPALATVGIDEDIASQLEDARQLELALERLRLTRSLYAFLQAAWSIVEPKVEFVPNWHVEELCTLLQEIGEGKPKASGEFLAERYIFNIPPGTLKSLLVTVVFPAWVWTKFPRKRFVCASYGQPLSIRDNIRCRDIIESRWYQELFPLQLVDDQNAKTRYNNDQGGWRLATSVDGVGTGEHPDFFIIDDPQTAQQADSEAERERCNRWYDRTVSTRGKGRKVVVLLVMQRLHKDDLSGYLLEREGTELVRFPMRYIPNRPPTEQDPGYTADKRDRRSQAGELLFPQIFTEKVTLALERDLGAFGTAGQLQQHPVPEGGGLFKRGWFKFLDAKPAKLLRVVRGWDTAATERGGDWTVGAKIAEFEQGKFIVLDVQRDQLGPADVDELMLATAKLDGRRCVQREELEGGASGKTVIGARTKLLVGYDHKGVSVSGSKIVRSKPFRAQVEAGNVWLLKGDWNEKYVSELCDFPTGKHDDQVDASSAAFNAVLLEPTTPAVTLGPVLR